MINITYLYFFLSSLIVFSLLYIFFNLKPHKTDISNKLLLKNLLEGLDMELPDELKRLDTSSTDPQKSS